MAPNQIPIFVPPSGKAIFDTLRERAKNDDAALSAFDRLRRKGSYNVVLEAELIALFRPFRLARLSKRAMVDIGGVAQKLTLQSSLISKYRAKARGWLKNPTRPDEVTLALLLFSGRRTAEVCGATIFYGSYFVGTVKSKTVKQGEQIYLCDYAFFKKGIRFIEEKGWRPVRPEVANKRFAVPLMRAMKKHFPELANVHALRKVYMAILLKQKRFNTAHERGKFINSTLAHENPVSALPYLSTQIE